MKSNRWSMLNIRLYFSIHECAVQVFDVDASSSARRVIVATNIAETSVTIPNIVYVIDCGFAKVWYWLGESLFCVIQCEFVRDTVAFDESLFQSA
jgi:hypothetical protein